MSLVRQLFVGITLLRLAKARISMLKRTRLFLDMAINIFPFRFISVKSRDFFVPAWSTRLFFSFTFFIAKKYIELYEQLLREVQP